MHIEYEQETDGRWLADVPSRPGVMAYGTTKEDARRAVMDVLEMSPGPRARCPHCRDEGVHQVADGDDLHWCGVGWADPDRCPVPEVVIDFCPFCGGPLP